MFYPLHTTLPIRILSKSSPKGIRFLIPISGPIICFNFVNLALSHSTEANRCRARVRPIPFDARIVIAKYVSIDTLIWWHEEFDYPEVDKIIEQRLIQGEVPKFTYGKLMEVITDFRKLISLASALFQEKRVTILQFIDSNCRKAFNVN